MTDRRTKIKIAHWYYELGLTQEQIAKKLQVSRQRVNKIVNSLVDTGIVTIKINGLDQQYLRLENILEERFSLQQAIIADSDQTEAPLLHVLGKKAAEFLDDYIQDRKTIGISWGMTLGETIFNLRAAHKPGCNVVQLVGGLNTANHMIRPDEITRLLARKLDCDYHNLYAPAILASDIAREIITKEESVQEVFSMMNCCDIAIMGIGELCNNATTVSQGYLSDEDLTMLKETGYVGDICFNHFKLDGCWEDCDQSRTVMGIGFETLKKIPCVVAIAGGENKVNAIIGALSTGCVDVLVTDSVTARAVAVKLGIGC